MLLGRETTSVASVINGEKWLGPLTTYSMPQSCSDSLSTLYNVSPGSYLLQGAAEFSTCFPSGYGKFQSDYYSPGVCPGGYTVACSRKTTAGSVTQTIQTCCPTHLSYTCITDVSLPWLSTLGCATQFSSTTVASFDYYEGVSGGSTTTVAPITETFLNGINAFSIQVRFQSGDLATTSTSSPLITFTSSVATGFISGPTSTASMSTDNTIPNNGGGGLSTAAAAGVGVGCGVAVVAFIGALVFFALAKRRRAKLERQPGASYAHTYESKPAQDYRGPNIPEVSGNEVHEMPSS